MSQTTEQRVEVALDFIMRYSGFDGGHHKQWCIDQVVRILHDGVPDGRGGFTKTEEYEAFVTAACDGVDGPNTYAWDEGCPP